MTTIALKERTAKILDSLTNENLEYASLLVEKQKYKKEGLSKYLGAIDFKKDALNVQKELRDEWD